jgi:choline dehydrogenase-like flavoprotein
MAIFDYDVAIVGSGFGGSVAALGAAEKDYRVGVMESGRRWNDEDIPKTNWDLKHYVWFPAAELYGIQRIEAKPTIACTYYNRSEAVLLNRVLLAGLRLAAWVSTDSQLTA